jgi:plastocyanin
MLRRLVLIAVAATVLSLLAPAAADGRTFFGSVGPGFTITLKRANGTVVHRIRHGTHTFVIRDRSSSHNFHLFGRGVDRRTGVAFTGRRQWIVRVRVGRYVYRCDPHRLSMRKTFRVV